MNRKHLAKLADHNWFNEPRFVSRTDHTGRWVFGDGTYVLILKGKPYAQEGKDRLMDFMAGAVETAREKKSTEIRLPSKSYLKKLIAANKARLIPTKIDGEEIFVDARMLYHITKALGKVCAYKTKMRGYRKAEQREGFDMLYLEGENGTGLLMPMICRRERIFHTGRIKSR